MLNLIDLSKDLKRDNKIFLAFFCIIASLDCYLVFFFKQNLLSCIISERFNSANQIIFALIPFLLFLGIFYYYILDLILKILSRACVLIVEGFVDLTDSSFKNSKKVNNEAVMKYRNSKKLWILVVESLGEVFSSEDLIEMKHSSLLKFWFLLVVLICLHLDNSLTTFFMETNTLIQDLYIVKNWGEVTQYIYYPLYIYFFWRVAVVVLGFWFAEEGMEQKGGKIDWRAIVKNDSF